MATVHIAVPHAPPYPYEAVEAGWRALGFTVGASVTAEVVCSWSPWRGSARHALCSATVARGAIVCILENGFLSPINGRPYYQVALNGWNGTGTFPAGDGSRWASWGLEPAPWVDRPPCALIVGQRGHPDDDRTCKPGWHHGVQLPDMPVILRGRDSDCALAADLASADRCHVWSSNAASHAIMAGVPVVQHGPNLMISELASRPGEPLRRPDRLPVLEGLAWSQWTAAEISTGQPFARLLT